MSGTATEPATPGADWPQALRHVEAMKLTDRQALAVVLRRRGLGNTQIGERLGINRKSAAELLRKARRAGVAV